MTHCRQLKFEETPDYTKYRKLFKDLFFRCGFEHEYIFDWTIQRYRVDKPSTSSHDGADENKSKDKSWHKKFRLKNIYLPRVIEESSCLFR